MQNSAMVTPPDKFKTAAPPSAAADAFLDPLPVPDATESSTDTVWGLWENTLRAQQDEAQTTPTVEADTDFQDTLPSESMPLSRKP
jgi:hypothetical protein